jgi:hypothetical protein
MVIPVPQSLSRQTQAILISCALFCLNAYICADLFTAGFLNNLSSNEGAFVSIARFFQLHPFDFAWFPWFNSGMPIENAYQPLLPVLAALAGAVSGAPLEKAFHFVLAVAWCAGPVTLFWFVYDWSESLTSGAVAALVYTLASPAEWFIPILRIHEPGGAGSLRLFNLIRYAEDPHIVALTLLPLALLFIRRGNRTAAIVAAAAVVLTNAFGAVDLAIGGLCIVLALRRGVKSLLMVGVVAWLWVSPWLTPSLIRLMANDQWGARGVFRAGPGFLIALAVLAGIWYLTRRWTRPVDRFAVLFVPLLCTIPLGFFLFDLTLVPQASRYQLELEMAVAIGLGCLFAHLPQRKVLLALLFAAGIWQTIESRRFARKLIQPIDITQTIQYKTNDWLRRNLPGQRAMVSGDVEFLTNVISENPQMSGGHEPTVPNLVERFAIYEIYTGAAAGDKDAEYSLLWLRAFGNQAVTVPAEKSREAYHPFAHPHKFDGVLPVLWHDDDDTIFAVPQRAASLAWVIPREALVVKEPLHGADVDPIRPYVAALDHPALLTWESPSRARISAQMHPGQVLSIQETWAPGWRATLQGRPAPIHKDDLGLIVIEPNCNGPCEVDLHYGPSAETWLCRAFSLLATVLIVRLVANRE